MSPRPSWPPRATRPPIRRRRRTGRPAGVAALSSDRRARLYRMVVRGSAWPASSWTMCRGMPAASACVTKVCRMEWGDSGFVDARLLGEPAHDAPGDEAVERLAVAPEEDRPGGARADGLGEGVEGGRRQRDVDLGAALAGDAQDAVAELLAKIHSAPQISDKRSPLRTPRQAIAELRGPASWAASRKRRTSPSYMPSRGESLPSLGRFTRSAGERSMRPSSTA